ncbi:MAG: amidohydrolase family protein [Hyphomicrobiales bacterium]|nr:amidohydrolase family protein [Hyphomicrobiales bacterium]
MIPLLDTHQHLIYRDRFSYAWADGIPALADGSFTEDDYTTLAEKAGIADAIFMETAVDEPQETAEARFALDCAAATGNRTRAAIVGCYPERAEGFDAWLDATADPLCVGYRRILHVHDDELSQTDAFRANIRKIGARGRVYDLCFLQRQLGVAYELAAACDNTVMVLDHCGVPDIAGGDFDDWRSAIDRLATLPNVHCKISGVVVYCGPDQDPEAAVRPYVEHAITAFGWDRVVWGGDWPVVNIAMDLPGWADITRRLVAGEDEANQARFFNGNARRIYRF